MSVTPNALIVDDFIESSPVVSLKNKLENLGFVVSVAYDLFGAEAAIKRGDIDCVFLDLRSDEGSNDFTFLELLSTLKKAAHPPLVYCISSYLGDLGDDDLSRLHNYTSGVYSKTPDDLIKLEHNLHKNYGKIISLAEVRSKKSRAFVEKKATKPSETVQAKGHKPLATEEVIPSSERREESKSTGNIDIVTVGTIIMTIAAIAVLVYHVYLVGQHTREIKDLASNIEKQFAYQKDVINIQISYFEKHANNIMKITELREQNIDKRNREYSEWIKEQRKEMEKSVSTNLEVLKELKTVIGNAERTFNSNCADNRSR